MSDPNRPADVIDDAIKSIKASLRTGGPPVDSALIMAFIDKELPPDAMPKVRALIDTWSDWNENYWSLLFAAASEHDVDEWLSASPIDCEIPLAEAKPKCPEPSESEKSATGGVVASLRSHSSDTQAPHLRRWRGAAMGIIAAALLLAIAGITFRTRDPLQSLVGVPAHLRHDVDAMLASSTIHIPMGITDRFAINRGNQATSMYVRPDRTMVRNDQPLLQWRSRESSDLYQIYLYPSGGQEPLISPIIATNEWCPTDQLARGVEYAWEVKTIRGAETLLSDEPRARFIILDSDSLAQVQQTTADVTVPVLGRVAALVQFGLLDEAESLLDETLQKHPESKLARSLRDSLQQQH